MGTLLNLIFCVLIMSVKMMTAQSTVYSSADTVLRFSQCLIEKISESQFFTNEDRNTMLEVKNVMAEALLDKQQTIFSTKILVIAFATSLADAIIIDDIYANENRKSTYFVALEQCSLSTTGYIDADFVNEAVRILSVIEKDKTSEIEKARKSKGILTVGIDSSVPNSQIRGTYNPLAVQPSPVQIPQSPQFPYLNDKTIFGAAENPYSLYFPASSQEGVNSQHNTQPSGEIYKSLDSSAGISTQSKSISSSPTNMSQSGGFSSNLHDHSMLLPEKLSSDLESDKVSQTVSKVPDAITSITSSQTSNTEDAYHDPLGGLNISQTKESSIIVIPPRISQLSDPLPETAETMYQPSSIGNLEKYEDSSFRMSPSVSFPQTDDKYAHSPSDLEPVNIVMNILLNFGEFNAIFNPEISKENAINLARDITGQSLSGYDLSIVNDALVAVSGEVSKVNVLSSENLALALSNSLVSVFKLHNLPPLIEGPKFAKNFISHLADSKKLYLQKTDDVYQAPVGGLNIPQTKESSVIVIPPKNSDLNQPLPQNPLFETVGQIYQPSSVRNLQRDEKSSFPMTPSASLPQTGDKYSYSLSNMGPANIVMNVLLNFGEFNTTFNSEIFKENAINLARDITGQSLFGYDLSIINDALAAVSDEVSKVNVPSSENFALALSNAMVSVFELHNLPPLIEGQKFAESFASHLTDWRKGLLEKQSQDYTLDDTVNSGLKQKQIDFDFQSPPISPEDVSDERFSESLARYLSTSDTIKNFFCTGDEPDDKIKISFTIIKSSLSDYGSKVSSLGASLASSGLSELTEEELCQRYATEIAESLAEVLEETGIRNANAESISSKIALSLSQQTDTDTESLPPRGIENEPILQTSLANNFSESSHVVNISHVNFSQTSDFQAQTFEDTQYGKSQIISEKTQDPESPSYLAPSIPVQSSPVEEVKSEYQTKVEYPNPITVIDSTEIPNGEFTSGMTLIDTFITLPDAHTTVSPENNSEDIMDKKEIAEYISSMFEEVRKSYTEEGEDEESDVPLQEILSTTTTVIENDENVNRKTYSEEESQNGNLNKNSDENKNLQLRTESEVEQKSDYFSTDSTAKTNPVELQPSFQGPLLEPAHSTSGAMLKPNSDTASHDVETEDTSLKFARQVSQIAESSIAYIRSQEFDLSRLCTGINELAPIVNIAPLDYCEPIPAIDYLLNVLRAVTKTLK